MRMPPQAAQHQALPDVNRTSLVFFLGAALILVNWVTVNGLTPVGNLIFHKGAKVQPLNNVYDLGMQWIGLAILALMAEYGGDGAGTFALLFVLALWLLWLLGHFGDISKGSTGGSEKQQKPPHE